MKNFFLTIIKNVPTILVSLLLGFVVWVVAVTSSDPTEEGRFYQTINIEMKGLSEGLVMTNDLPETVSISLRAPNSIWRRMTLERTTATALIDVTDLGAGEYEVPLQVSVGIDPIQITSYSPQTAKVILERYETREYEVIVKENGEVPTAFRAELPVATPGTVSVSGPVSLLDTIDFVRVVLDHSNATETIEKTLQVAAIGKDGVIVKGLTISPEKVSVKQVINLRGGYRVVAVKLITSGEVPSGYRVTNIGVDPGFVTIYSADRALLDSLPSFIETEPVRLDEISENVNKKIELNTPEGVTLVGDQTVNLNVVIGAIEGTITITDVPVYTIGLEEWYSETISPATIDVYLSGPINSLSELTADDIFAVVELKDKVDGSYQLEPRIDISSNDKIVVQSILPASIEVQIVSNNPLALIDKATKKK